MKDRDFMICMHNNHLKDIGNEHRRRLNLITSNIPEDQDSEISIEDRIRNIRRNYSLGAMHIEVVDILEAMNKRLDEK